MINASAAVVADLAPAGELRAAINLGNPVLAQGTPDDPRGVTVDIAREVARRLDLSVRFVCVDAARLSFQAVRSGEADVCFLAIEPARETEVAFTAPYVVIEGVYAVPRDSDVTSPDDVDRDGVRVGVKHGSAYDLYLTRTLSRATIVRGDEGVEMFHADGLEVGAGIRQPVTAFVHEHPEYRLVDGRFMEIRQAMGTTTDRSPETVDFLRATVEELQADGFVTDALQRSGQADLAVAPPA